MKIVALVHYSAPHRMAGSETMLHTMLKASRDAGHEVLVVATEMPEVSGEWIYDGVPGVSVQGLARGLAHVAAARPDLIVTHHQNATAGIQMARRMGVKSAFLMHNDFGMNNQILAARPDLTVFNTEWMARAWSHKAGAWMVVHPPVWAHEHATTPGDHVTLINLNEHKGGQIFSRLARHFPDLPFLGVTGGHGHQITHGHPDNVEVIPQTSDMKRDVWSRTKVLLVPSVYESYGMVAVEALASGIPVIATPTPGLAEALGDGGRLVRRDALAEWVMAIRELMTDSAAYGAASARALARSQEMDPEGELRDWVRVTEGLCAGELLAA
ncbi:glycosyltransferase family 4 protein [Streptomyces sp. NPDC000927]|uniref:glycosyltransferase family 4 protein n=1 Tax=Streptomyces sp. NPDC000927 TaxID=3154371 RepID=UPI00332B9DDB